MKKISIVLSAFLTLITTLSWAATPPKVPIGGYTIGATKVDARAWQVASPMTKNLITKVNTGDTLSNKLIISDTLTPLVTINDLNSKPIPKVKGLPLGFKFPFAGDSLNCFGITGNGLIFLGKDSISPLAGGPSDLWRNGYQKTPVIYFSSVAASEYSAWTGIYYNPTKVLKGASTKISYNPAVTGPGRGPIGPGGGPVGPGGGPVGPGPGAPASCAITFENMQIMDFTGKALVATYQIILTQNGKIDFLIKSLKPSSITDQDKLSHEDSLLFQKYKFTIAIADGEGDKLNRLAIEVKNSKKATDPSWTNPGASSNSAAAYLCDTTYPFSETPPNTFYKYTFTPPTTCVAPNANTWKLSDTKVTSVTYSGKVEAKNTEGILVLISTDAVLAPENKPIDGIHYKKDTTIGTSVVAGLTLDASWCPISAINLTPATQYYAHYIPYNYYCANNPAYGTDTVVSFKTAFGAPTFSVQSVDKDSIVLNITQNTSNQKVMLAWSEKEFDATDWQNRFLLPTTTPKVGDIISQKEPVTVKEVDLSTGLVSLKNLKSGTAYYFYAWSYDATNASKVVYSPENATANAYTIAEAPTAFYFYTNAPAGNIDPTPMPCGWSRTPNLSGNFSLMAPREHGGFSLTESDFGKFIRVQLAANPAIPLMNVDAITPAFTSNYAKVAPILNIGFKTIAGAGSYSKYLLATTDTLYIQYSTNDGAWITVDTVLAANQPTYGMDGYGQFTANPVEVSANAKVKIRYYFTSSLKKGFIIADLQGIILEPVLPCAYPVDIKAIETTLSHKSAQITWTDKNLPAAPSYLYSYSIEGGAFSPIQTVNTNLLDLKNLAANTSYDIKLQAVCGAGDSSLWENDFFTTLFGMPFSQIFANLVKEPEPGMMPERPVMPAYFTLKTGLLAQSGNTVLSNPESYPWGGTPAWQLGTIADFSKPALSIEASLPNEWFLFPTISMESITAPAVLDIDVAGYDANGMRPRDLSDSAKLFILLSKDGNFNASNIVKTIQASSLDSVYQPISVDISTYSGHLFVALYWQNTNPLAGRMDNASIIADSISIRYTQGAPCYPVANIKTSDLTTSGVTLKWEGSSLSYGISYKERSATKYDTIYTTNPTYTFSNLKSGSVYKYSIVGYCGENRTNASTPSKEAMFSTIAICEIPANFRVIDTTWASATFVCNTLASKKMLHLYAKDTAIYPQLDWTIEWNSRDTLTVSGLYQALNITYKAEVRSICAIGDSSDWTAPIEFTTYPRPDCGTPTKLTHKATKNTADLNWTSGINNEAYIMFFKKASATKYDTIPVLTNSYALRNLEANTAYTWKICGVCFEVLASRFSDKDYFITEGTATEDLQNVKSAFRVNAQNGQVIITNLYLKTIDRVEIYQTNGQKVGIYPINSNDNVFIPLDNIQNAVLMVRIISGDKTATYKIFME
ncbi:MAG: hypothetical protein RR333_07350 [Bacteroidales bacterium]